MEKLRKGKRKNALARKKTVITYHLGYEGNPDSCVRLDELQ